MILIESSPVIAHKEQWCSVRLGRAELDTRMISFRCEFPGIANQIFQDNSHKSQVALRVKTGCDLNLDVSLGVHCAELPRDAASYGC